MPQVKRFAIAACRTLCTHRSSFRGSGSECHKRPAWRAGWRARLGMDDKALVGHAAVRPHRAARAGQRLGPLRHALNDVLRQLHLWRSVLQGEARVWSWLPNPCVSSFWLQAAGLPTL